MDRVDQSLIGGDFLRLHDRIDRELRAGTGHTIEDDQFLLGRRIAHHHLQHESVHLSLGQGIGSFLLDRILGRQHEKGIRQRPSLVTDGHLPLLHGLQQCGLHFARGAVDFIGQHQIGKNRSLPG